MSLEIIIILIVESVILVTGILCLIFKTFNVTVTNEIDYEIDEDEIVAL